MDSEDALGLVGSIIGSILVALFVFGKVTNEAWEDERCHACS